jgi:hypothetical protein
MLGALDRLHRAAVAATAAYEPKGEFFKCRGGSGLSSCFYETAPSFALPVTIGLWVATGLVAAMALVGSFRRSRQDAM